VVTRRDAAGWERRRRAPPRTSVYVADEMTLEAPAAEVFARLRDADTVALCLPGVVDGSLTAHDDDSVTVQVRQTVLGVAANWQLRMRMRPDALSKRLEIGLTGIEQRLGMKLNGDAAVTVAELSARTTALGYRGHVTVEGRLATTGAPIINRIVEETLRRFAAALGSPAGTSQVAPRRRVLARFRAWLAAARPRLRRRRRP
jgi:carbon monoxide dehydrogenase subunit G